MHLKASKKGKKVPKLTPRFWHGKRPISAVRKPKASDASASGDTIRGGAGVRGVGGGGDGVSAALGQSKTGPQVYVIREDVNPAEAVKTGQSSSVCNLCPLQPALVKAAKEAAKRAGMPVPELPVCYVTSHYGPRMVWATWRNGGYPKATVGQFKRLFRGRKVRLGAYGNFSNVALAIVRAIAKASAGWTLYEHNWRLERVQPMRALAIASVSTFMRMAWIKITLIRDSQMKKARRHSPGPS